MEEAEYLQNQRLALQEANNWIRFIDNFYWILSAFWLVGTGMAISKVFEFGRCDWQVLIIGIILIVAWVLFLGFTKNIIERSKEFIDRANSIEDKLNIDVLQKNQIQSGVRFITIMKIAAYLSIVIGVVLIVQIIIKN